MWFGPSCHKDSISIYSKPHYHCRPCRTISWTDRLAIGIQFTLLDANAELNESANAACCMPQGYTDWSKLKKIAKSSAIEAGAPFHFRSFRIPRILLNMARSRGEWVPFSTYSLRSLSNLADFLSGQSVSELGALSPPWSVETAYACLMFLVPANYIIKKEYQIFIQKEKKILGLLMWPN